MTTTDDDSTDDSTDDSDQRHEYEPRHEDYWSDDAFRRSGRYDY